MGICLNKEIIQNSFCCFNSSNDKNTIIINLDKIKEIKNKSKNKINLNNSLNQNNIDELNSNIIINNENKSKYNYIFYKFKSKFKTRNSNILSKRTYNNINCNTNKYNKINDNCEKLIHFSNFVINNSSTTYSVPKCN